jgi:uncharacterized protein involved in exopolysaccharide biosynthesis
VTNEKLTDAAEQMRQTAIDLWQRAESEAAALRAEVERLRCERNVFHGRVGQLESNLAEARALLRQVHAEQAPTVSLLCAIGDLLAANSESPRAWRCQKCTGDHAASEGCEPPAAKGRPGR